MGNSQFLIDMGKRIYARRKELKLTQEAVAEAMDLSLQSISCIELGKKAIRPENLVKLCRVLSTSPDYILNGTRSKEQLSEIETELASLSKEDFLMVKQLVKRLNEGGDIARTN